MDFSQVTDKAFFYMRGKLVTKGAKKGQYIEVKPQIQELELLKAKLQDNKEYTHGSKGREN